MNGTILVVDDSTLSRKSIKKILESGGYSVEEANDGASALERYFLHRHDLVMLDLVMEGMYGLDVLAKLKELDPKIRVVLATADVQQSTREEGRAAGASGLINKPFNRDEVLQVVSVVLEGGVAWK